MISTILIHSTADITSWEKLHYGVVQNAKQNFKINEKLNFFLLFHILQTSIITPLKMYLHFNMHILLAKLELPL